MLSLEHTQSLMDGEPLTATKRRGLRIVVKGAEPPKYRRLLLRCHAHPNCWAALKPGYLQPSGTDSLEQGIWQRVYFTQLVVLF
jgi:hypothetical protein